MKNILNSIVEYKTTVIANRRKNKPLDLVKEQATHRTKLRGFVNALEAQIAKKKPAIIKVLSYQVTKQKKLL